MMKQNPSEESFEKLFKKSEILVARLKYISSLYRKLDEISSMVELLDKKDTTSSNDRRNFVRK